MDLLDDVRFRVFTMFLIFGVFMFFVWAPFLVWSGKAVMTGNYLLDTFILYGISWVLFLAIFLVCSVWFRQEFDPEIDLRFSLGAMFAYLALDWMEVPWVVTYTKAMGWTVATEALGSRVSLDYILWYILHGKIADQLLWIILVWWFLIYALLSIFLLTKRELWDAYTEALGS